MPLEVSGLTRQNRAILGFKKGVFSCFAMFTDKVSGAVSLG
jgi:hypothetical protein